MTAGILVSLAAALGAFVLLYRLAESRLGAEGARRAVLYLAVFPMAFFLQAVYSEALFLLLTLGAFLAAERGPLPRSGRADRAGAAHAAGGLRTPARRSRCSPGAHRSEGARSRRWRSAPAIFALYPLYLWREVGDPWAFMRAQDIWTRHLSPVGPLGGIWDGLRAGWAGVRQLASGSDAHVYWSAVQNSDPDRVAALNLQGLAYLALLRRC